MPWGFLETGWDDAPLREALFGWEIDKAFRDAPSPAAGEPAGRDPTRVFKFFEVFFELGLGVFFMRRRRLYFTPDTVLIGFVLWNKKPAAGVYMF